MKRTLFTAKVDSHIKNFHIPFIKTFKDDGWEVDVVSEGDSPIPYVHTKHDLKFGVNPFSPSIYKNYQELKKIIQEGNYEIVHTHTAIASVLTRIACNSLKKKKLINTRVIYTAHGFHFLKKGSFLSWIIYFPVEFICSYMTDDLILINKEDYKLAQKFNWARRRHLVNGVGVDLDKFGKNYSKKKTIGLSKEKNITYVAEFSKNKNHKLLIESFSLLVKNNPNHKFTLHLIGDGSEQQSIKDRIVNLGLSDHVVFYGIIDNVDEMLKKSDLAVSTSKREGLPMNIIESMASGLPIVATKCRGHNDLVVDNKNGFLVEYSPFQFAEKMALILNDESLHKQFSNKSEELSRVYDLKFVIEQMKSIYFSSDI